jgi:hypothetical protein
MKIKILVGILVFLIVVNLATIGTYVYFRFTAPPPGGFQNRPHDSHMPPPIRDLGDAEREKMFGLMHDFIDETNTMRDSVRLLEHELFRLFQQNPVMQENIDSKLKDIAAVKVEISKKAAARFIQAKTFLSPEQQERFFDAIMQSQPDFGPGGRPPRLPFGGKDSIPHPERGNHPSEFNHPQQRP